MSSSGTPPENPYGEQPPTNPYGEQPAADPYGQPPAYGQQPTYGQSPYGQPGAYQQPGYGLPGYGAGAIAYAHWGKRVGAYLIDAVIMYVPIMILAMIGGAMGDSGVFLTMVGYVVGIGIWVWNVCIKQGSTGYSIGKGVLGIKLISEQTGQPIGGGMSFVRQLAHIVDAVPCYLGYLWPLWDAKRQTFADKIVKTIVVDQPQNA